MDKGLIGRVSIAVLFLLFDCTNYGCSSSRLVQPLHPGKTQINVGAGGPLFKYQGTTIPIPLSSVSAAYGLEQDLSVFRAVFTTDMIYGTGHGELGFVKGFSRPEYWQPGISVTPSLHMMLDGWEWNSKFYPTIDINLYWQAFESRDIFYVGSSNWFELSTKRTFGEDQPRNWIPTLNTGYTYVAGKFSYNAELKLIAPLYSNKDIVVDYTTPLNNGAIGFYVSMGYTF